MIKLMAQSPQENRNSLFGLGAGSADVAASNCRTDERTASPQENRNGLFDLGAGSADVAASNCRANERTASPQENRNGLFGLGAGSADVAVSNCRANERTASPQENRNGLFGLGAGSACIFDARIETQMQAYCGMRNAPNVYLTDSGTLLSHFDGVLTIGGEHFDANEMRQFIRMCGCHTVVCGENTAAKLERKGKTTVGTIMRYAGEPVKAQECVCREPRLDDVFALLQATFENMQTAIFDAWYCDIALKQRRGLAFIYGIYEPQLYVSAAARGTLCATAGVYYQNAQTAVIGSVATRQDRRGHGLAAKILCTLIARVQSEGKLPQIVCQNDRAHVLYSRLGFVDAGKFVEISVR